VHDLGEGRCIGAGPMMGCARVVPADGEQSTPGSTGPTGGKMALAELGENEICSDNPVVPLRMRCDPPSSGSEPNHRSTELTYTPCA
jgi:hypothetical protein